MLFVDVDVDVDVDDVVAAADVGRRVYESVWGVAMDVSVR
jgi:hypothetical protein